MAMNFHDYPYTDLHEMNLDWCIAKVKELTETWLQTRQDWEDTQQAWEDMKTYINNYFDNLNVQTEINNKIDALVSDGTLSDLIAPYVASGLPAVVADQISAVVAAQIGDVVAAQISAVVAAQLPEVVATETAGQAAAWLETHVDPETGYVIDDSLTIQGAAADAKATGDAISDLNNALTYIQASDLTEVDLTWEAPVWWYNNTGTYRSSGGTYAIATQAVSVGDLYHLDGWLVINGSYLVFLDSSDNVVQYFHQSGSSSTPVSLTFKIPSGVSKIVIQQHRGKTGVKLYKLDNIGIYADAKGIVYNNFRLNSILGNITAKAYEDVTLTFETLEGFYNASGTYITNSSFTGATISVNGDDEISLSGQVSTNMATLVYFDADDNYMGVLNSGETGPYYTDHPFTIPSGASKVLIQRYGSSAVFSCKKVTGYQNSANASIAEINSDIDALENGKADVIDVLTAFDNITCVGDSLTWGQVYTGNKASRKAYVTYPQALAKITGTQTATLASAGFDASEWWDYFKDDIEAKTNQLAIVYLGTNAGFTDTLSTDAPENTDPSTWASTNTGSLAKIVNKFQTLGAKVCMVKCYATNGDLTTTNSVIEQVATRFHCGIVDNADLGSMYHLWPDLSGNNPVHYNDLGYSAFARILSNKIARMDKNILKYLIP